MKTTDINTDKAMAACHEIWPTAEEQWPTSTPEEQGMDSTGLLKMVDEYQKTHAKDPSVSLDSITIVRRGHIVADMYLNPYYPPNTKHIIHSCTKSIMSALIGIAIEKGFISSVNVPVLEILKVKNDDNVNDQMRRLTLQHLLTMQTGLHSEDSYLYQWRGLFEMQNTDDWTQYILNLPMDVEPGTRFDYSNMSSFLLSAIITTATGMDTLSYARKYLFQPLGIDDVEWAQSPKGVYIGWARMWLKPHDMAKIGLLYLRLGRWEDQQVIPAEWVKESTTAHSFPKKWRRVLTSDGKVDYSMSNKHWIFTKLVRPFADGYGYQWWLDKDGMYSAVGVGGQYIMVVPDKDLIVVFTSKLKGPGSFYPAKLLKRFILPAIRTDGILPPNTVAQKRLERLTTPPKATVERKAPVELPFIAKEISGETYVLESNKWHHDDLQIRFLIDADIAELSYTAAGNETIRYQVGLDNVYRLTDNRYAARGRWESPTKFIVEYEQIGYSNTGAWTFTFDKNEVIVEEVGGVPAYQKYKGVRKL